jgi:hypothetical protein
MVDAHEAVGGATSRGKPDPSVVVPPAVKKAAERSEELVKQAKEQKTAREAQNQITEQALGQAAATPASNSFQVTNFDPANPAPPAPVFAPDAAPIGELSPDGAKDMEHQINSLRGRYEREQENTKRLSRQIADMQHLMASVNSAPPQSSPASQGGLAPSSGVRFDSPIAQPRYVTPQEVKEYGEELMDVVGRRAREIYEPIVAQLTNELNSVRQQVGGVRNTVAYDASVKMYESLAQEVPNWETINGSNEFARWLDQPDPLTGQMRRNILAYSHRNNMAGSVIAAFKGFLSDQASFSPPNSAAAPGNGAESYSGSNPAASTPQVDLKQFAAPGRAKSGQTQVPPEKPIYSAADIAQFYRDKTAGRYAGREADADALERSLYEAGREGRIRR